MSNSKFQDLDNIFQDYSIKDVDDPLSLVNICPSVMAEAIRTIPDDIITMSNDQLEFRVKPNALEQSLRQSFAFEYHRARKTKTGISLKNIVAGHCDQSFFTKKILTHSYKLAYIIRPLVDLQLELEMSLRKAVKEINKILDHDIIVKGKLDSKAAMVKFRLYQDLMDRRRGHVLNKTEITTKSTNVNIDLQQQQIQEPPRTVEEIQASLEALEKQIPKALGTTAKAVDELEAELTDDPDVEKEV